MPIIKNLLYEIRKNLETLLHENINYQKICNVILNVYFKQIYADNFMRFCNLKFLSN